MVLLCRKIIALPLSADASVLLVDILSEALWLEDISVEEPVWFSIDGIFLLVECIDSTMSLFGVVWLTKFLAKTSSYVVGLELVDKLLPSSFSFNNTFTISSADTAVSVK